MPTAPTFSAVRRWLYIGAFGLLLVAGAVLAGRAWLVAPAGKTSTNHIPAGWLTYTSRTYAFSMSYPSDLTVDAEPLSEAVASQRADGLVTGIGFHLAGVPGPVYLVRVYTHDLEALASSASDIGGSATGATRRIGSNTFHEFSGVRRYGIAGPHYTYILDVQSYSDTSQRATLDRMLETFRLL